MEEAINVEEEQAGNVDKWVQEVQEEIPKLIGSTGGKPNPYFLPSFAKELIRIARAFPMWSAVMKSLFDSPRITATTASVESDFNNLKNLILRGETQPLQVHKLADTHLNYINGLCKIVLSNKHVDEAEEPSLKKTILSNKEDTPNNPTNKQCKQNQTLQLTTSNNESKSQVTQENSCEIVDKDEVSDVDSQLFKELNYFENWRNKGGEKSSKKNLQSTHL